jgi:cation diffusion facilitator family transporter
MRTSHHFELPAKRQSDARKARHLEWLTIAYLCSVVVAMYLVMGSSQAMKTAWVEDILSLVPPVAFLIADRVRAWPPTKQFPYGHQRATTIAFLLASFALLAMGVYLAIDAVVKLAMAEHPTIGGVRIFSHTIWLGWLMIPVLVFSVVPSYFLGRSKLPLAKRLHDKSLHTDADMNKADWLTGVAAMAGVLGIALSWWWADAVAALIISASILKDGWTNTREVIGDLMDRRPQTVEHQPWTELPEVIQQALAEIPWAESAEVRLREHGRLVFGEIFVVPRGESPDASELARTEETLCDLDWRLHELLIQLVPAPSTSPRDPTAHSVARSTLRIPEP